MRPISFLGSKRTAIAVIFLCGSPLPQYARADEPISETVGKLSYSNQWVEEKIGSYLYLSYGSGQLSQSNQKFQGEFNSNFGSSGFGFPSIDLFSRILSFANPESPTILKDYSVWGRYSVGLAVLSSNLTSDLAPSAGNVGTSNLLFVNVRIGASLEYDHLSWMKPYLGFELDPYFYRNTSYVNFAEKNGASLCVGPMLGVHFPVLFSGSLSLLGEARWSIPVAMSTQILGSSVNGTGGVGLTF